MQRLLLQPRDYTNSLQLLSALGLMVVGLVVAAPFGVSNGGETRAALEIVAPPSIPAMARRCP